MRRIKFLRTKVIFYLASYVRPFEGTKVVYLHSFVRTFVPYYFVRTFVDYKYLRVRQVRIKPAAYFCKTKSKRRSARAIDIHAGINYESIN